jgi:hypothetical protein
MGPRRVKPAQAQPEVAKERSSAKQAKGAAALAEGPILPRRCDQDAKRLKMALSSTVHYPHDLKLRQ